MKKEIKSTFKETPKTRIGWWAFGLSLFSLASGPILGISSALIVPFVDRTWGERPGQIFGFGTMILMVLVLVSTLILGIKAYLSGERSWGVVIALVLSGITIFFWSFMILGEFLFPH